MSDNKPPVIMGDVTKVFNEPFTTYEKQRLQNVQQSLCMRQRRIVALKKELTKLLGETKKENEARLLGEGGVTLTINRGTYPKLVECMCMVDEETWEVFLTRKDDGREVPSSRRALTDAQIKAHKKSRSQLNMFGEGSWTPIRLPELTNESAQQCDDIPVEELESAATAEIISLEEVRAMLASDLLAVDTSDDDDDDEDNRPRKRKGKGKSGGDAADKKRKSSKPDLQVIKSPEPAESGPYASDVDDDTLTNATTIPPSVRVVYVICVDGAIDTIDADEARHLLDKCAVVHGAADTINEDALPEDRTAMDRGILSTGHNYAIHQLVDTSLAGFPTLVLEKNGTMLGYVAQDEQRATGFVDIETTVTNSSGDAAQVVVQSMPRPTITIPDTLKAELTNTLKTAIRNNGGSVNAGDLLALFAKESEFDLADVPVMVRDNLVPICNEMVLDGVLVCRGTGDDVQFVMPNVVQHEQLH